MVLPLALIMMDFGPQRHGRKSRLRPLAEESVDRHFRKIGYYHGPGIWSKCKDGRVWECEG